MIGQKKESKFTRFAEVLPQNARTAVIIKEREEIRLAKEATEKALKDQQQKEERDRKKKENQEKKAKEQRDRAADEARRKEQMEQEESKKLDGRMLTFMQKAQ